MDKARKVRKFTELGKTSGFSRPAVVLWESLGELVVIEVVVDLKKGYWGKGKFMYDVDGALNDVLHVFRDSLGNVEAHS